MQAPITKAPGSMTVSTFMLCASETPAEAGVFNPAPERDEADEELLVAGEAALGSDRVVEFVSDEKEEEPNLPGTTTASRFTANVFSLLLRNAF